MSDEHDNHQFSSHAQSMNDRLTAFRLPDYLLKRVDDLCMRCNLTRSRFLRWAIIAFFERHADELEGNLRVPHTPELTQ